MQITCPQCNTVAVVNVNVELVQFACPACHSLITYRDNNATNIQFEKFGKPSDAVVLKIGQKGKVNDIDYYVTGIIVKKVHNVYFWREYILTSESKETAFLSESDGHWIFLKEVPEVYNVKDHKLTVERNEIIFNLYNYENTSLEYAEGIFNYSLPNNKQRMAEYINAHEILSIEIDGDGKETAFFGEHISRAKVKKAFEIENMPAKTGIGLVQPFFVNVRNLVITLCAVAILILVTHLVIYKERDGKQVVSQAIALDQYNNKDFVSAPFLLEGGSAPLTVALSTDVNNSWANVQVALVNEITNEEEYASKDIEYYQGYESGERWSEGDTSEDFNICGVAAGRYHIVITPQKPPEDLANNALRISVKWDEPSMWNVALPILFMLVIAIGIYYWNNYFEQKKWADSSYAGE